MVRVIAPHHSPGVTATRSQAGRRSTKETKPTQSTTGFARLLRSALLLARNARRVSRVTDHGARMASLEMAIHQIEQRMARLRRYNDMNAATHPPIFTHKQTHTHTHTHAPPRRPPIQPPLLLAAIVRRGREEGVSDRWVRRYLGLCSRAWRTRTEAVRVPACMSPLDLIALLSCGNAVI